jgi:pyruvate,water dikinase
MAALPWTQDRQHVPEPITPMSAWWASELFAAGFSRGLAAYGLPLRAHAGRFNSYFYLAVAPFVPPEQMPEYEAKAVPLLMAGVANFARQWKEEWLPEIEQIWDDWGKRDLRGSTTPEMLTHLDAATALFERIWELHFRLLVPAFVGFSTFVDFYAQVVGVRGELAAYRLLQGFDSKSIEAGRGLWALSRTAKADPAIAATVASTPSNALHAKLGETDGGRAFLKDVDAFLQVFGKRSDTVQEFAPPSWVDDPTPLYDNLKAYVQQDEDPSVTHRRLGEERERLIAEARATLKGKPEDVRHQFEALLAAAQMCTVVQEDHNFWIDQRGVHEIRTLCMEFGRRFVASGDLEAVEDIFLLTIPEVKELGAGRGLDARTLVAQRKAEMEHFSKITPPMMIGTDYGPPPENPVTKALGRFFGQPMEPSLVKHELKGNAGSAGKVRGVARVIISITDAGRLQPGEILVTATTSPPWTPFFATAGAIVTDTGGPLSHCAIVAREYGIPAVVGTMGATAAIRDGQLIEVDGDMGIVRLIGE